MRDTVNAIRKKQNLTSSTQYSAWTSPLAPPPFTAYLAESASNPRKHSPTISNKSSPSKERDGVGETKAMGEERELGKFDNTTLVNSSHSSYGDEGVSLSPYNDDEGKRGNGIDVLFIYISSLKTI